MLNKISSQQAHDIIQKAAQAGWHPSHMKNGINLDKSIHNGWDTAHSINSQGLNSYLEASKSMFKFKSSMKKGLTGFETRDLR